MDKINLKDILDGKLTKMPFELDIVESQEFVIALADALATLQQTEFSDVTIYKAGDKQRGKALQARYDEFAEITDNFILFMMSEDNAFSAEIVVAAFLRALRTHQLRFDSETDAFAGFFREYHGWIVSDGVDHKGVYVGDGKWDKKWKPSEPKKLVAGSGGHFTLRDHHKNQ